MMAPWRLTPLLLLCLSWSAWAAPTAQTSATETRQILHAVLDLHDAWRDARGEGRAPASVGLRDALAHADTDEPNSTLRQAAPNAQAMLHRLQAAKSALSKTASSRAPIITAIAKDIVFPEPESNNDSESFNRSFS